MRVLRGGSKAFSKFFLVDKRAHGKFRNARGRNFGAVSDGKQCGYQKVVGNVEVIPDPAFVEFGQPVCGKFAFCRANRTAVDTWSKLSPTVLA